MDRFAITSAPLATDALMSLVSEAHAAQAVTGDAEGPGAVSVFVGLVRNKHAGRRVDHLEYEAYEPLALRAFERIADEVAARVPDAVVAIHHRVGRLGIGEASVLIAAASAHRAEAFAVCRYAIERIKQIAPVWKHEVFEGGASWVEGATAQPDEDGPRDEAWRRAWL
jgi:molybdopterin synthase catalytic subunit